MDKKILENSLNDWARNFGFSLPDGSLPPPGYFSPLVATPHRCQLWEAILNKVESKEKVRKIRKQILLAALRSFEINKAAGDCIKSRYSSGIEHKVELWRRKRALELKIGERRKQFDELHSDVCKKTQLFQSDICKIAEFEKNCAELKEKFLMTALLTSKYKNYIKNIGEQLIGLKSYGIMNDIDLKGINLQEKLDKHLNEDTEDLLIDKIGLESDNEKEIYCIVNGIKDSQSISNIWKMSVEKKVDNFTKYLAVCDQYQTQENLSISDVDAPNSNSMKCLEERLMLDATENSLHAILNKKLEEEEKSKLNNIVTEIERIMFNASTGYSSIEECSYIQPNKTGDSLTGRNEKMAKFLSALSYFGLKKRVEYVNREIEKINDKHKKIENRSVEKMESEAALQRTTADLMSLKAEAVRLVEIQKTSTHYIMKDYVELESFIKSVNDRFIDENIPNSILNTIKEIKKSMEMEFDLFSNIPIDAFRRIQISLGKEIFECESLAHCLDHFGGEHRDLFTSLMLSPFDRPDALLLILERRKEFLSYISDLISKNREDLKERKCLLSEKMPDANSELEKNYSKAKTTLSKILNQGKYLDHERILIEQILKCWLEQSYRFMVPDNMTVDGLTLRQYEEKYQRAEEEIKYSSKMDQSVSFR